MKKVKIDDATWKITGRGCDCYLLIGEDEAIMIDSGCDHDNIQVYASTITNIPINTAINTHSHFDHTGGNSYFKRIYMSEAASRSAKNYMDEDKSCYRYNYDINYIEEGYFPFKGRPLEIIMCDVHSPGNIMILDYTHRLLFTGDEIDHDQVLLLPGFAEKKNQLHARPATTVYEYKRMLKHIWTYENLFDKLCTGHNGSPLNKEYILKMIACCEKILKGEKGNQDCSSATYRKTDTHYPFPDTNYFRLQYQDVSLVYCADNLYDRNQNSIKQPATPLHLMCEKNIE